MTRASEIFALLGKHQLVVHLDCDPVLSDLQIRYSYPLNAVQVSAERIIRIPRDQVLRDVHRHLDHLVKGLTARMPPPAGPAGPDRVCRPTGATILIQDGRQGHELPLAWLRYEEDGASLGSRVGKAITMNPDDFTTGEFSSWDRLRQRVRGIAWAHYQGAVAEILR